MILASEDIGLADPTALTTAVAAADAVAVHGMPEGRINLAQATIALALAPKSNAVIMAIDAAMADVSSGRIGLVPRHLRDAHYPGAKSYGHGAGYQYAHDHPHGIAAQQYLPDELTGAEYYRPTEHGAEAGPGRATGQDQRAARPRRRVGRETDSVVTDQEYGALATAPYRAVGASTRADVATTELDPVALAQFLPVEGRLGALDADSLVREHGKDQALAIRVQVVGLDEEAAVPDDAGARNRASMPPSAPEES